jgi:SSS family transporter
MGNEKGVLIGALVVYFLVLMGIGYAAARRRKNAVSDYYLGGRDLGPLMMIMTIAASWFSVSGFIGIPSFSYLAGPDFLVYGTWNILIALGMWYVGVRAWLIGRRFNYVTPTEMYADYYGGKTVPLLVTIVFLLAIIPQALVQLTGAGKSVLGLAGIPYWVGVVLFVAVVGIYSIFGGLRAVVWADVFQGLFMMVVGLFMPIALIWHTGGIGHTFSTITAREPQTLTMQHSYLAASISQYVQTGIGFLGMPYIFQRFFMARSPKVLGQSFIGAATIQVWIFATTSVIFGIAAHAVYTQAQLGSDTDVLVTKFFADYYPVLGAIVVAAAFAHGNSVISAIMLTGSSIFSVDLYKRYFNPTASEARIKRYGQGFIVVYMIVLVIAALEGAGGTLLSVLTAVGFGLALQVVPAMMGPLFWPRITRYGAASGLIVGVVVAFVLQAKASWQPWGLYPGTVALPVNIIVTAVVSMVTKPVPYSTQEAFHGYIRSRLARTALSVRVA